jgi:hypothetical protein
VTTFWKPVVTDREKWWKLALEASYCISKIQVELPEADVVYQYKIEVSVDDLIWKEVISDRVSSKDIKVRTFQGDFGCDIAFVRISFISEEAGLTEVRIGGK